MSTAPSTTGHSARLASDRATAQRLADFLIESLDERDVAVAAFETAGGGWTMAVYFSAPPNETALRALVALEAGAEVANALVFERIETKDWVAASLQELAPVAAGRFLVHGRHDRARVRGSDIGVEIEAALAFGTGHHGTTRGCLLALDALARRRQRPRRILDIGTGTGVLAIAVAKIFRVPVLAVDIDPHSVAVARDNARLNGVGSLVTVAHAAGLHAPDVIKRAPFDLVLANILLRPLQRLAAPVARQLVPNARVVISGVLTTQANAALGAYRSQGLMLERSFTLDGWFTPVMVALSV
jgi:ribosomal protein L11 methyltransferase